LICNIINLQEIPSSTLTKNPCRFTLGAINSWSFTEKLARTFYNRLLQKNFASNVKRQSISL